MHRIGSGVFAVTGLLLLLAGCAYAYPENYLSPKSGASVSTTAKLGVDQKVTDILSDDPAPKGRFIFADVDQQQEFVVDFGQERTFDRVAFGTGNAEQPRNPKELKIEVSSTSADGPYKTVFTKSNLGWQQILRLPLVKGRWVRFDLGKSAVGVEIRSIRIYKGYEHPKLVEVTKLLNERIKQDIPELDKYYAAVKANDWKNACKLLRAYFATTHKVDGPPNPDFDLSMANDFAAGKLNFASFERIETVPIDWSYEKNTDWYEHCNFINRGALLGRYVDAYFHTQDKKWSKLFKDIFYDWIDANPKPPVTSAGNFPSWRTLDSSCRTGWLTGRFSKVTAGKDIDDELWANWLLSVWEHADYLRKDNFTGGNWLAMTTTAVMDIAMNFPQFKDQTDWLVFGKGSFENNVLRDILPDGKEIEDAPGYNCMAYNGMFTAMIALDKTGVPVSPEAKERMSKMLDYLGAIIQPDGGVADIGDSGGIGYNLRPQADYFKREDFKYVLTSGKEGKMPATGSMNMPHGRWVIMRGPYEELPFENARHLIFKLSRFSHGHSDVFNLLAYGYGRQLLIDPGIRSYEREDVDRYLHTNYHNTVCIDGRSQSGGTGEVKKWASNAGLDYALGEHNLYKSLISRRSVLFVKPDYWIVHDDIQGEGEHTYDQNWHFAEDANISEDSATKAVRTNYATGGNIVLVPVSSEAMKSESVNFFIAKETKDGSGQVESKGWKYSKSGKAPQTFDLVMYPYLGATAPKVAVDKLEVNSVDAMNVTALKVNIGDDTVDYVITSRNGQQAITVPSANISVDGEVVVIRTKSGVVTRVSGSNIKSVSFAGKSLFSNEQVQADVDIKVN